MIELGGKMEEECRVNGLLKVKGRSKKVVRLKGTDVKNRFSVLDQIDEKSNIVRDKEDGTNDIVLGDSQVRDLGIGLSNIGKVRARKRLVMCYPRTDIDFIKNRLKVANGFKGVILYIG